MLLNSVGHRHFAGGQLRRLKDQQVSFEAFKDLSIAAAHFWWPPTLHVSVTNALCWIALAPLL